MRAALSTPLDCVHGHCAGHLRHYSSVACLDQRAQLRRDVERGVELSVRLG
jgi:hypothetical protein